MGILSDIVNESKKNCGCGKDPCETYGNKAVEEGTQGCADCEWISDETDGDITTCDDCAAEKREKTNEAEKRWKQTSMSPEEAIEKYGKENVKVKKGALRNGDDMVEVFVESMVDEADRSDVTHAQLLPHIKNVKAAMVKHSQEDPEEAGEFIEHLDDMMNAGDVEVVDMMQPDYMDTEARDSLVWYFQVSISKDPALFNVLFPGEDIKFATKYYSNMFESYSPGDEYTDSQGMVSDCCGAPMINYNDGFGRCGDCKEMSAGETEEEYYESEVSRLRELSGITEAPTTATLDLGKKDPQNMKPGDITDPEDALIHKGKTRGVNDPFDASGTRHADGIGWSQDELDGAMQGFKDVLGTENQIQINRYLAGLPLDIAKSIADQNGYGVFTNPETGKRENPGNDFDTGYDHVGNPNYGADAMDPETIAKIKDPNWRDTFNMQDPKFKNIRPTEATNEEIEAEIKRLQDLIKY